MIRILIEKAYQHLGGLEVERVLCLQCYTGDPNIAFTDMHPPTPPKFTDIKNPCNHNHILFCEAVSSLIAMNFQSLNNITI